MKRSGRFFFFSGLFIGSSTLKILARMSRDASLENDLYCSLIRLRTNGKQTIAWLPNLHFLMQIILRKVSGIPLSVNDVMSYLWNRQRHRIKRGLIWTKAKPRLGVKFTPYTCHPRVNDSNGIAERSNKERWIIFFSSNLLAHTRWGAFRYYRQKKKAYYEIVLRLNRSACTNTLLVSCP